MDVKAPDANYTYQELRVEIGMYITAANTLGLLSLINPTNIRVIEKCDSRLIDPETQTNTKSVEQLRTDYEALKVNLASAATVDSVLAYYTSTNANLSRLSGDFEDIIMSYNTYSIADISTYTQLIDDEGQLKDDNIC